VPKALAQLGSDSITVESLGGLGNQLFILAYALRLREETGLPVTLDISHHQLSGARQFELLPYLPSADLECQTSVLAGLPIASLLLRVRLSTRTARFDPRIERESSLAFDPRLLHVKRGARVRAYVQSWRYLPSDISLLTSIVSQSDGESQQVASQVVQDSKGAVAIHVRLGDYKKPQARRSHPLLTQEYYGAALSRIRERFGSLKPVIYSDSPSEALEIVRRLPLGKDAVMAPETKSPIETLCALSSLDALVMSNSSLSWWAAWRMGFLSERIIAPRTWSNRPDFLWEDLIPEGVWQNSAL